MENMDRRRFLRLAGFAVAAPLGAGVLASCGGGSNSSKSSGGSGSSSGKVTSPKLAISSTTLPSYLVQVAGPILYGSEFGLHYTQDDIVVFQSHATAIQAALSGKVHAVGASTMGNLAVIAQGSPFRLFQPYSLADDYVLAARGIKTVADLKNSKVVIGIDSAGGAARSAMDAMLLSTNAGFLVEDLKNVQDIESSGERQSALASGQVTATIIHKSQAEKTRPQAPDLQILATLYSSVPKYLKECYAAPKQWLDQNQATATAISASIIKASRELKSNEDTFVSAVHKLIKEPPPDSELKSLHELIVKYDFWPVNGDGLSDDRVEFMIKLGEKEGLLEKGALTPAKVVDKRPMDAALKKLGKG